MSSIIRYRITSVTSQSPNYPASNLTSEQTTLGWQSQYSPTYPQELNIQFFVPIRTKTLKLTFHQYKIPSYVEVFIKLSPKQNFRKLGYITPNDNSQSNYEHKQIKTLYFQFPCSYIKLVFYQNYKNEMNLFEQVALDQLTVQGQVMTHSQLKNIDLTQQATSDQQQSIEAQPEPVNVNRNQSSGNNNNRPQPMLQTSTLDQLTKRFQQVYVLLQEQKAAAVQNEDFKLAAYIKNAIQSFRAIQNEITNLQVQKLEALQHEDFDKCHKLKQQISKKRQEFEYRFEQLVSNEQNFMAEFSHSRIYHDPQQQTQRKSQNPSLQQQTDIKNYFSTTPQRQIPQRPIKKAQPTAEVKKTQQHKESSSKNVVDHNEQIIPAVRKKMMGLSQAQGQPQEYPSQYQSNKSLYDQKTNKSGIGANKSQNNRKPEPKKSPSNKGRSKSPPKSPTKSNVYNEKTNPQLQPLDIKSPIMSFNEPTSPKSKTRLSPDDRQIKPMPKPELSQLTDRFKHLDLDPLDLKLRLKLESHFDKIPEPYWQIIMHKSWKVKKEGLEYVRDNISIDNKGVYIAVMQYISFSINDPHPQVLLFSLNILRKLIQQGNANQVHFTLPHLPYFIQTIISSLLNLINSTNKQLSEQSTNLYLMLGMISFLSVQLLVTKLIKHKQTAKLSAQYVIMKISLMISIIEKYHEATKYFKEIAVWAAGFLEDPSNKVRNQAGYLLLILTDQVGEDKVINSIKDKPNLLEAFYTILNTSQLAQQSRVDTLGEGSRITDRNLSKVQENNSIMQNKSVSRQKPTQAKNKSNIYQNPSKVSNQQSQKSNRLKNPWTSDRQKSSRRQSLQGHQDQQLQYSKDSNFYGSSVKKQTPSEVFVNRGYGSSEISQEQYGQNYRKAPESNEIKVLEEQDEQNYRKNQHQESYQQPSLEQLEEDDPSKCDFCFMDLHGLDQRTHLMTECKVIAYCEQCMGRIYIRQIIEHLLYECSNKTHHQQCKRCGLVFNINEINEHVGQGLCRLQRGEGWERCQFCGQEVMANDAKWIQHAYKCPNLPEPPITQTTQNVTEKGELDD